MRFCSPWNRAAATDADVAWLRAVVNGEPVPDEKPVSKAEQAAMEALHSTGHPRRCVASMIWGDGTCLCGLVTERNNREPLL